MSILFTKNKLYTVLLLVLPVIIAVSWLNNVFGNYTYTLDTYLITHILPAFVISYIVALIAADYLHSLYQYSYQRVLFTFVALMGLLLLFSYVLGMFGYKEFFLTAQIPLQVPADTPVFFGITASDPLEASSKVYSFQLIFAFALLVIIYTFAMYLFKGKKSVYAEEISLDSPKKKTKPRQLRRTRRRNTTS